jgi:hypothetical protein
LPARANTLPWFSIPNAFQNGAPFSSVRATSSWACAAAAARLPQRAYGIAAWANATNRPRCHSVVRNVSALCRFERVV